MFITNLNLYTQANVPIKDSLKLKVKNDAVLQPHEEFINSKVICSAQDSSVLNAEKNILSLYNNASVRYENMELKAGIIELDMNKNTLTAYASKDSSGKEVGLPVFTEGSKVLNSKKIVYNLKTKKGQVFDITTKESEFYITGKEVYKDSNNVMQLKDLSCIPCDFADARTKFRSRKALIIPNDKILTGPLYLEIGGVPTFLALPFGYFPNTKSGKSGIIVPTYGSTESLGFFLRDGGYYYRVNERMDLTLKGDLYANGSWALRAINSYHVKYKYSGNFSLSYSEISRGEKEIPGNLKTNTDFALAWIHVQDSKKNPNSIFSSNVNIVTPGFNTLNSSDISNTMRTAFQSSIRYNRSFKTSNLSINARHDQNIISKDINFYFPEITYNINQFFPFNNPNNLNQEPNALTKLGITYALEARNQLSGKQNTIFEGNLTDSMRYGIRQPIQVSTNFNFFKQFVITPAININTILYDKTIEKFYNTKTNKLSQTTNKNFVIAYDANFSTDFKTQVAIDYLFTKTRLTQIRHLVIPTLRYNYQPDFTNPTFGFYKSYFTDSLQRNNVTYSIFEKNLYGGPSQGKQNSLGLSLNNNLEGKIKQQTDSGTTYKKFKILHNLNISSNYNFANDTMPLEKINVSANTVLFTYFNIVSSGVFNPYYYDFEKNRQTKQLNYSANGTLAKFEYGNIAVSTNINNDIIDKLLKNIFTVQTKTAAAEKSLPWNISLQYNFVVNATQKKLTQTQTLGFQYSASFTKNWQVRINGGYDLESKSFSPTQINVKRDLRCWEAEINWVPMGRFKSYTISIYLKSSMFRDLKIPRQRTWLDNL